MTTIFVVDDSRGIRLAIRGILKGLDCNVVEACDGKDACDKLQENGAPDAILLDWNMPNMDGLEFLKHIRADANYQNIPVIMVTTNSDFDKVSTALGAGANEYVMKPFDKDLIVGKLQSVGVTVGQA